MMLPSSRPADPNLVGGYVLVRELASDPVPTYVARRGAERFIIERLGKQARASHVAHLIRLRHPNLASVREMVDDAGGVAVVSDYVEGLSFEELERKGGLPLEAKLRIAVDLLNGLSALHGHSDESGKPLGLVHGNVSPGSVIVGIDGSARLVHLALHRNGTSRDPRSDLRRVSAFVVDALRRAPHEETKWAAALVAALKPSFATAAEMSAQIRSVARTKMASTARVAAQVRDLASGVVRTRRAPDPRPPAPSYVDSGEMASGVRLVSAPPATAPNAPPALARTKEACDTIPDYEPFALADIDDHWGSPARTEPPPAAPPAPAPPVAAPAPAPAAAKPARAPAPAASHPRPGSAPRLRPISAPEIRPALDTVPEFPDFLDFVANTDIDVLWANATTTDPVILPAVRTVIAEPKPQVAAYAAPIPAAPAFEEPPPSSRDTASAPSMVVEGPEFGVPVAPPRTRRAAIAGVLLIAASLAIGWVVMRGAHVTTTVGANLPAPEPQSTVATAPRAPAIPPPPRATAAPAAPAVSSSAPVASTKPQARPKPTHAAPRPARPARPRAKSKSFDPSDI